MKWLILACLVVMMSLPLIVWAEDGNNVSDQLGDIFSGKGQTYAGVEINNIPIPLVKIEPITLTAWADGMVGEIDEGIRREIRGGIRLAIDWQKIFK